MRGRGRLLSFTLMELLAAFGIIAVLVVVLVPVIGRLRARAQRVHCMANLRSLHVGANLYVQEHNGWPQIPLPEGDGGETHAKAWIDTLKPHSVPEKTWICPTMQNLLGRPDLSLPENVRVDYTGMTFDSKPTTPYQWATQPWFVENGDVHGNGNLIIFTDGSIRDLKSIAKKP